MKKRVIILLLVLFTIFPVYAERKNRLYFTESGDRLVYSGKLLDENVFMKHTDLLPGGDYYDELYIENATHTDYQLYFKVTPREQSVDAYNLLENLSMTIAIDGNVIYEGIATGVDLRGDGINLQGAIALADIPAGRVKVMEINTHLSELYSNTQLTDLAYIDWSFYAQYTESNPVDPHENDDPVDPVDPVDPNENNEDPNANQELVEPIEIVLAANTMKDSFPITVVLSILFVIIGIGIILYVSKKKK